MWHVISDVTMMWQ